MDNEIRWEFIGGAVSVVVSMSKFPYHHWQIAWAIEQPGHHSSTIYSVQALWSMHNIFLRQQYANLHHLLYKQLSYLVRSLPSTEHTCSSLFGARIVIEKPHLDERLDDMPRCSIGRDLCFATLSLSPKQG